MINGYGICLNEWLEDERIKTELRLLIKISSFLLKDLGYSFEHSIEQMKSNEWQTVKVEYIHKQTKQQFKPYEDKQTKQQKAIAEAVEMYESKYGTSKNNDLEDVIDYE